MRGSPPRRRRLNGAIQTDSRSEPRCVPGVECVGRRRDPTRRGSHGGRRRDPTRRGPMGGGGETQRGGGPMGGGGETQRGGGPMGGGGETQRGGVPWGAAERPNAEGSHGGRRRDPTRRVRMTGGCRPLDWMRLGFGLA